MFRIARRVDLVRILFRTETGRTTRGYAKYQARLGLGSLLLTLVLLAGCGGDPGPEVWVIGLDGADWDQLDPMIARGELPNLALLKQGGATGVLRSEKPLISPILWTTIATGKSPDKHGVTWFMTDNADGTKTPVSSAQRQVRSFWNIASEAGLSSGVVGWWATWPADPIEGFVVSDYVGWHSFGVNGHSGDDAGKTWPADLMNTVRELLPDPARIPTSQVAAMVNLPVIQLSYTKGNSAYDDPVNHLRQAMATSRGYTNLVLDQLDQERPELLAVYFEGTDAVTHLFGDYQAPRLPWVTRTDYDAYHKVVNQYWRWQDKLLGELLARRNANTTVIIVSDHGFRIGDERRKEDAFHIETADADHMFDGIVIINGPGVQAGARLSDADIYDVAPTVLYALGLPVAADMDGRVLTGALATGVVSDHPVRSVVTYETSPMIRQDNIARPAGATEDLEKMLRSLGYIAGTNEAALPTTQTAPEEIVNLATVLMHQGRFDEAIAKLTAVADDHPEIMEVRLNLAQALVRSGRDDRMRQGETLYRELLFDLPERLEIHEDLTTMLLNAGRNVEALTVFELGLAQDAAWVNGLAGKGLAQYRLGRDAEALATLQLALLADPRHVSANLTCGQLLLKGGRDAEGLSCLETAHNMAPANPTVALKLALALQKHQTATAALQVLQSCLDSGGPRADLLAEKGAVLMRQGNNPAAIAALQAALKLDEANVMAMGNLGVAYAMNGKMSAAITTFEKVVDLEPDLADGHAQLGALYAQTGRMSRAEQEFRKAVNQDPDNANLLLNLGQVQVLRHENDEAREVFREVLRLNPSMVPALYQLGELEKELGNTAEAERLLQRARFYERGGHTGP